MAKGRDDSVLHFTCDSCGTHLGVDESLAGLEAPCPKCGTSLIAPEPERDFRVPSAGVVRGVSGGANFQVASRERRESRAESRESGQVSRKVYPTSGRMPNEDEKDNLKVFIKIVIATVLVILIVLLVAWYLKNH